MIHNEENVKIYMEGS